MKRKRKEKSVWSGLGMVCIDYAICEKQRKRDRGRKETERERVEAETILNMREG